MQRMLFAAALAVAAVCAPCWCQAGETEDKDAAQQIARYLRDSGRLQHYSLGVKFKDGTVWLAGQVTSEAQMQTALQLVSNIEGVTQIVNNLEVGSASADGSPAKKTVKKKSRPKASAGSLTASQASAEVPLAVGGSSPAMTAPAAPAQAATSRRVPRTAGNGRGVPAGYNQLPPAEVVPAGPAYGPGGGTPMPAYVPGTSGGVAPAAYDRPSLPNYSWPSYAAYPNYAAVTYPRQYSATAWPFIGPFYPYPQVPMGWRRVSLEWDDGWWFLDFQDRACF